MNKTVLSINPVISRQVVQRKRKYVVSAADLLKTEAKPVLPLQKPKSPPAPHQPIKAKKTQPEPMPVIPREERIMACLAALQETWPMLFDESAVVLWEVGIRKKMWRALNKKYSRTLIAYTLARWQEQHPAYKELLKAAGNPRYGLDGTVTMQVTEDQAQQALLLTELAST